MKLTRRLDAGERFAVRHWIAPRKSRTFDQYFQDLSEAGQYSRLWLACAALIAAAGGSRGRRAAGDGVLAIGLTSALVNGVLKLVFRRRRPVPQRLLRRYPRTSSFPSGHAASAFAFTSAVSRTMPEVGNALVPLAASMAYSRVYLGVHYPTDVIVGAAVGSAVGPLAHPLAQRLGATARELAAAPTARPPLREAVLVSSPHSGNSRKLAGSKRLIEKRGIQITAELDIGETERLRELLAAANEPLLVIAAGGDGTVGSVAGCLVGTEHVLGIMPLGTSNDYARSLGVSMDTRLAAMHLVSGDVIEVDAGSYTGSGDSPRYFVHAATAGINVDFAKLATRASVRERFGRLTYLVAAVYALREHRAFECVLTHDGRREQLSLLQLSVINAPIVGGPLGLSVEGSRPDDNHQAVIAVEDVSLPRLLLAGVLLLLRVKQSVGGVRTLNVRDFTIETDTESPVSLDGEVAASLPGEFKTLPQALRVLVPRGAEL